MKTLMTRDQFGMGADPTPGAVCWTDTGAGITPANYQDQCCGFFATMKPSCIQWTYENSDLFHGDATDPCSSGAGIRLNLSIPGCLNAIPPLPTAPPPPLINPSTGEALTPAGGAINTPEDANAVLDAIIKATSEADKAQIRAWLASQAKTQCASQATICGNNTLLRKVSADCTGCALDFTSSTFWMIAVGVVVGAVILTKVL